MPRRQTLPAPEAAKAGAEHDYNAPENQKRPPAHVREIFRRFDANGDGTITREIIDRYAVGVMAGIAAEAAQNGKAEGGQADETALVRFLGSLGATAKGSKELEAAAVAALIGRVVALETK